MNSTVVTGANGLLGSAICKYNKSFIPHNRNFSNLEKYNETLKWIKEKNPDTIIHCAAKVGGVYANSNNNLDFYFQNKIINRNMLDIAIELKIPNFISILSTCIFPDNANYPLTADQIDNGDPHPTNCGYAYSKRLLYHETKYIAKLMNLNWFSIIPTNLYGINDNFNLTDSHIIPGLIHKAFLAKRNNTEFVIWGDGTPVRQFLYIDDFAKIIDWSLQNWNSSQPLMAVNETPYSIKDVAILIADIVGIDKNKIIFDESKPKGQMRKPAKSDINWFEFTPLEVGLQKTIKWFFDNYEIARK